MKRNPQLEVAAQEHGIHLPGYLDFTPKGYGRSFSAAMDAQPDLVTVSNNGIPAYLLQYMDPAVIEVLVAPMEATSIYPEGQKGSWVTEWATFPTMEYTGQVATYGDFSNNGTAGANPTFVNRQAIHAQTITIWGERQLEQAGEARIDWAGSLNRASALVLNKFRNSTYFFGVSGLVNYGILTDPALPAAITPATKTAGGVLWINGNIINATANEVYLDIQSLFLQLARQSQGLIKMTDPMLLCMSPASSVALTATNQFNVSVADLLKKNFPRLEIRIAPEYATVAGQLVQLIATEVNQQPTGNTAFTERLRAHAVIPGPSSFNQKKSAGAWGAIIYRPYAVAQLLGV